MLNSKAFRAYSLLEAVEALQPCLAGVSSRYAMTVTAKAGA